MDDSSQLLRLGNMSRPPIFYGSNFCYWKIRMIAFIQGTLGDDVWDLIENGYTHPTVPIADGSSTLRKLRTNEMSNDQKKISNYNNKGKNAIVMSVCENELKCICHCTTS